MINRKLNTIEVGQRVAEAYMYTVCMSQTASVLLCLRGITIVIGSLISVLRVNASLRAGQNIQRRDLNYGLD